MKTAPRIAISTGAGAVVGGATGGVTYAVIGGVGLAIGGTAVGITLVPMIAIGAVVGAGAGFAGSVLYSLGKKSATEERIEVLDKKLDNIEVLLQNILTELKGKKG